MPYGSGRLVPFVFSFVVINGTPGREIGEK